MEIRGEGTIMRTLTKIFGSILAFSLLVRLFFALFLSFSMPLPAHASFLSSILGEDAYAETRLPELSAAVPAIALQANVSSASIFEEKNSKNDKIKDSKSTSKESDQIDTNVNVNIVSDNAILPSTGPLGVSDGKDVVDPATLETSVYVVRKGDSISAIAGMLTV